MIPPIEFHLMMGIVNHLVKFLKETCPDVSKWLAGLKIVAQPCHGDRLQGPECQKILKKLDCLQELAK